MQCMVLEQPGKARDDANAGTWLTLREREDAAPGAGEIALEVSACAVCRTDLQLCEGDLALRRTPVVPGHQVVGRVSAVGEGVTEWKLGERAGGAWLAGSCGICVHCTRGKENLCERAAFMGWDRDGGYGTRALLRADFALHIPERFDDVEAAPLLCGGVIGYRSLMVSGIRPGGRLGLYGFGASALIVIQVAVHWGCEVFVCTRNPAEQARARSLGAVWAGGYEQAPPAPLDAAITFAPSGDVVVAALRALDRGGVVAINAIHLDRIPTFAYEHLWWERSIRSVANFTRDDARAFLALAAEIPIRTAVDAFPLAEANRALEALARGNVRGAAVLTM